MQNEIGLDHALITPYVPVALYFEEAEYFGIRAKGHPLPLS